MPYPRTSKRGLERDSPYENLQPGITLVFLLPILSINAWLWHADIAASRAGYKYSGRLTDLLAPDESRGISARHCLPIFQFFAIACLRFEDCSRRAHPVRLRFDQLRFHVCACSASRVNPCKRSPG